MNLLKRIFSKKKKDGTRTILAHQELSKEIQTTDAVLLIKHKKTAQQLANLDFKNIAKGTRIKSFLGSLKSDYQKLVDKIDKTLAGKLSVFQSIKDIDEAKKIIKDLNRKILEVVDKLVLLKGKLDEASQKLKAKVKTWTHQKVWILYFLAVFELVANFGVYQLLGGSAISAIAISILSAFVVFWWGHITPKYVVKFGGNNLKKQLLLFVLFASPIFLLFYMFSSMRIQSLLIANPEMADVFVSSPIIPTLINFFGYLISCYLVYNFRPSKQEMDLYKKYLLDTKEIEELEKEREILIQQKNNEVTTLQNKLTEHYNFLVLAGQLETEVNTHYKGNFEEFKAELYLRTNSKCDVLFTSKDDLPPLELQYQNIDKTQFELCETELR